MVGEGIWDKSMEIEIEMKMAYQSEEDTAAASSHKSQEIEVAHHLSTASNKSRRS